MQMFQLSLSQMLMMFVFMLLGFVLRRSKILPENAYVTMSRLETYIFVPATSLSNLIQNCTVESFANNSKLIWIGGAMVIIAIVLAYPLSCLFIRNGEDPKEAYRRCVFRYALAFGNYGFMGNFIVLGIWGDEMFFKYIMFTLIVGIFCNAWGMYVLIPKDKNAGLLKNLKKGLLTPPMIAVVVGIILGFIGVQKYLPAFVTNTLDNAKDCMGPLAMTLAGVVVGGYELKSMFNDIKVYAATFMRLILIPAVMISVMKLLHIDNEAVTLALICFATPLGLNTVVYPSSYGGDPKTGASMAMISHTLSVITIPLMYLVFVVLWK